MLALWPVYLAVLCTSVCASYIRGVRPQDQALYKPVQRDGAPMFRCLHTDKWIPMHAVNDDYCDCPDGSDEPGTSACPNGTFHCENKGYVPATLRSSRVDDGVCDPECCDGSDEMDGKIHCPNVCAAKAAEAERKRKAHQKIYEKGARLRASYVDQAKKQRAQHEKKLEELLRELDVLKKRADDVKTAWEKEEMSDQLVREMQKQSPLYKQLEKRQDMIQLLSRAMNNAVDELRTVARILEGQSVDEELPAVKSMKEAYELWLGETEDGESLTLDSKLDEIRDWAPPQAEIDSLANADLLAVLNEQPGDVVPETNANLWHIPSYLPETLVPVYEQLVSWIVHTLVRLDVISPEQARGATGRALDAARAAHEASVAQLEELNKEIESHKGELKEQTSKYGRNNEFQVLQGTCMTKDMGSYTYELCFGGKSTQISNNDGYRFDLGRFSRFDVNQQYDVTDDRHYLSMMYDHGQGCWNGPTRTTRVTLECGETNELLKVIEAEKCTYTMHIKTPAVCFPPKTDSDVADEAHIDHEEL